MNFVEQWFGLSPDGGSGTLEFAYAAVGVLLVVAGVARVVMAKRRLRAPYRNL